MATLGQIVAQLDGGADMQQLLAQLDSPSLFAKLEAFAGDKGRSVADCARDAVRAFSEKADDDAWVKLLGKLNDTSLPAAACLKEMLLWALKR